MLLAPVEAVFELYSFAVVDLALGALLLLDRQAPESLVLLVDFISGRLPNHRPQLDFTQSRRHPFE